MKFLNHNLFTGDITVNGTTTLSTATGVTRATGDNTTHLATTAFVKAQDYATNTALGNYVPLSRTLTINGVTFDLSANRSWTIGTADYTSTVKHIVKAGVAITKGQAVYVTSADGTNMIVGLASNATEATSSKTMGLVDTTVAVNGFTNVITEGLLAGLDTSTAGTEGDPVWLGINGNLIYGLLNKPYAPAHLVFIGIVTRKNANNGEIFVKVQNGFELNEIHDVDLKTVVPVNGHILGFDGTLWVNKTIAAWLGYTPANASGTTNYVSKFTGTTTLGNSQIFDNGTNVGIGTTAPGAKLDVNGDITGRGSFNGYAGSTHSLLIDWSAESQVTTLTNTNLFFGTNAQRRMTITAAGNVGVNTTAPYGGTGVTSVTINATSYPVLAFQAGGTRTAELIGFSNHLALNTPGFIALSPGDAEAVRVTTAGNVGIGTTTPAAQLELEKVTTWGTMTNNVININNSGTAGDIYQPHNMGSITWLSGASVPTAAISAIRNTPASGNNVELRFSTADSGVQYERMVISVAGNVGIGTMTPNPFSWASKTLTVASSATNSYAALEAYGNGTGAGAVLLGNTSILRASIVANDGSNLVFAVNASNTGSSQTERMRITASGYIGVASSSPVTRFTVNAYAGSRLPYINGTTSTFDANGITVTSSNTANASIGGGLDLTNNVHSIGSYSPLISFSALTQSGLYNNNYAAIYGVLAGDSGDGNWNTGHIAFATTTAYGTSEKVRITSAGNVGIGTTNPSYKLVVNGAEAGLYVNGAEVAPYTQKIAVFRYGGNGNSVNIENQGGKASIQARAGASSMDLILNAAGSNVGIGTASPLFNLQVGANAGTVAATTIRLQNSYLDTNGSYGFNIDAVDNGVSGHDLRFLGRSSPTGGFSELVRVKNTGNVGIGTTSPSTTLDVLGKIKLGLDGTYGGSDYVTIGFGGTSNGYNRVFGYNGTSDGLYLTSATGHGISFRTNGGSTDNMFINSAGNVGIGTTSPLQKLDVNGNISLGSWTKPGSTYVGLRRADDGSFGGGGDSGLVIESYNHAAPYTGDYSQRVHLRTHLYNGGSHNVLTAYGTNVGVGIDTPTEKLHVVGRARITTIDNGTGDFATISGTGVITRRTAAQVLSDIGAQPSGSYLTAEADTLATVTGRGNSTATTIISTNNANVDGANFTVDTVNKTVNEYAYKVSRSGSAVGGILIDGRGSFASGTTINGSTAWHAGNDGSGSGLDADLLDGQHASAFAAASHNHDDRYYTETESDAKYLIGTTNPGTPGNFTLSIGNNGTYSYVQSHSSQPLRLNPLGNALEGPSGSTIWHSGNDGSSSGLDADLLDGNHASAFYLASNPSGYISSYTETDTLATVTARGSSTNGSIFINGVFTGGLGAVTTSGTLDWNDVSNARAGQGYTLLLGTATNGMGGGQYYHPVSFEYSSKNGSGNMTQLAIPYTGNGIWYRNRYGGSWSSWARVWDDSSFTSTNISNWNTAYGWGNHASQGYATQTYVNTAIANLVDSAPSTLDTLNELAAALGDDPNFATTVTNSIAAKLPLAGGTMTGTIYFSNDMGTALQGTIGDNDFWRIRGGNSGSNAGFLEIATSDDGTEPIYVRQYTGVFSSLTRTATLLDGSGNTSLPGSLTVGGTITENSSIRYKENVVDLESATEKVEQLRAVRYNKIGHEIEEIGLIAEEVAEVYPEVVNYNEEGQPDGVNYTRLSVILLKALQEQNAVIASLSERINKLESK